MNDLEQIQPPESFVVLSAAEWRNFLALGRVRLLMYRILSGNIRAQKNMQKALFVRAPHGNLEDSGDYRVVELSSNWLSFSEKHSYDPEGNVVVVSIDAMISTFPAAEKDRFLLEDETQQLKIPIGKAEFEEAWNDWMLYDGIKLSLAAGNKMANAFGFAFISENQEEFDLENVVKAILGRSDSNCDQPLLSKLVEQKNEIRDFVADDIGNESFIISCVCEWVFRVINIDLLSQDQILCDELKTIHLSAKDVSWNQPKIQSEGLIEVLQKIQVQYPEAFNKYLTPIFIPLFIQHFEDIRSNKFHIENTQAQLQELAHTTNQESTALLAFCLGVELKLERVRLLLANPQLCQSSDEVKNSTEALDSQVGV